jgi:hypothetical protein
MVVTSWQKAAADFATKKCKLSLREGGEGF